MRQLRSFLLAASLALVVASPAAAGPQRIVSLNLCADQLVLALADRSRIAGVTRNAADPGMSAYAAGARGLRRLGISGEEVLAIEPDLIVGRPGGAASALLARAGYAPLDVPPAETLAEIKAAIRRTAAAIGHPARGAALVARMDRELAAIPRHGRGKVAVYYQRRGFVTGAGTLVDEIMTRAGLVNLATRLGKPALSQLSLEEIVAAQPDYLIVERETEQVADQGTEMLHHPALRHIPRLSLPQAWTVCGSPAYVLAVRSLSEQLAGISR